MYCRNRPGNCRWLDSYRDLHNFYYSVSQRLRGLNQIGRLKGFQLDIILPLPADRKSAFKEPDLVLYFFAGLSRLIPIPLSLVTVPAGLIGWLLDVLPQYGAAQSEVTDRVLPHDIDQIIILKLLQLGQIGNISHRSSPAYLKLCALFPARP